jgi:hypothetical protein
MAQVKKKLSKKAKEALQILKESKLLNETKAANNPSQPKNLTMENNVKTIGANKMRPDKKRG